VMGRETVSGSVALCATLPRTVSLHTTTTGYHTSML